MIISHQSQGTQPVGTQNSDLTEPTLCDRLQAQLQRQYPTVTYTRLDCVNDDPDFLKIAAEWANPHIAAMLSVPQHHEHIQTRRLDFD